MAHGGGGGAIGGVSGPGGIGDTLGKVMSNILLDTIEQQMSQSGMATSEQTRGELHDLRDAINGVQKHAAGQVSPSGSQGAGGPQGAGAPKGGGDQQGADGILQMLMQVLQLMMQLMQQLEGKQNGGKGGTDANDDASQFAGSLGIGGLEDQSGGGGFGNGNGIQAGA